MSNFPAGALSALVRQWAKEDKPCRCGAHEPEACCDSCGKIRCEACIVKCLECKRRLCTTCAAGEFRRGLCDDCIDKKEAA